MLAHFFEIGLIIIHAGDNVYEFELFPREFENPPSMHSCIFQIKPYGVPWLRVRKIAPISSDGFFTRTDIVYFN